MKKGAPMEVWGIGAELDLDLAMPVVMGILNVTPDSFHDGGRYEDPEHAVARALELAAEGARIIDVGGESTRPGAERVGVAEQIDRTAGVIEGIRAQSDCAISIDTTRAAVAEAALAGGANVVNDVSAGLEEPEMLDIVAKHGCGVVLMHRLAPPEADSYSDRYESDPDYGECGVLESVRSFLRERVRAAMDRGVAERNISVDPGLGFGKSVMQNMLLLGGAEEIVADGAPVVIGASRKSFIGGVSGASSPNDRLPGSLAAALIAANKGVQIIRAHDVRATVEALAILEAARDMPKAAPDTMPGSTGR
jgi:dihydropteroate synthase